MCFVSALKREPSLSNTELATTCNIVFVHFMNLPNSLSLFRVFLAIVFTAFMTVEANWGILVAFLCFLIASITDWLDGYLARKLNLVTDLGKLLDPLADKILVAAAFVCFTERGICPAWMTVIILFREFAVTGLRLLLVEKGVVLPADQWGKWKTVSQILFCILTLVELLFGGDQEIGMITYFIMYICVTLTVFSGLNYTVKGMKLLK